MRARLEHEWGYLPRPLLDDDHYLLTADLACNVKLRDRTDTLKLKVRSGVSDEGLERWFTEFAEPLPAAAERWMRVGELLGVSFPPEVVEAATAAQAVERLKGTHVEDRLVSVRKRRLIYSLRGVRLEWCELAVRGSAEVTVNIEAPDPDEVRAVQQQLLDAGESWRFESYPSYLLRLVHTLR